MNRDKRLEASLQALEAAQATLYAGPQVWVVEDSHTRKAIGVFDSQEKMLASINKAFPSCNLKDVFGEGTFFFLIVDDVCAAILKEMPLNHCDW